MDRTLLQSVFVWPSVLLLHCSIHSAFAVSQYQARDLGPSSGTSWARAVNDSAVSTGAMSVAGGAYNAFIYQNNTLTNIGNLVSGNGATADGYGINNSGVIVGRAYNDAGQHLPFIKESGGMQPLSTLPSGKGAANAINSSGVIAGWSDDAAGKRQATRWTGGAISAINPATGQQNSYATAINTAGAVVGSSFDSAPQNKAFFWSAGVTTILQPLSGRAYAIALGLNDADWAIGQSYSSGPSVDPLATLWRNGQRINLGALSFGSSVAEGINNSGQIVGNVGFFSSGFLWESNVMYDLNSLLVAGSGLTIVDAAAISNNGYIVGQARNAQGQFHAVLLTPVPEPASALLLCCALALIARRRGSATLLRNELRPFGIDCVPLQFITSLPLATIPKGKTRKGKG